ncbi:PhzF family phenazine biosynthesis protein [Streptosporangium amethystogenes]|uniref:PhzF family phenazine biosynthesis protein n=1 Tax=Streptosporangium amethystogenes TaxID=2002 RepID=UPI0004C64CEE|nr:PhzF family phenazine biosynthesis protein [Streptosporangium amethystogenes]
MRFHVFDTFADANFAGNPAAVVVTRAFPAEEAMQREAHQIGLPTTAFVVPVVAPDEYRVRWFTPYKEINLCGHATIASARHLFDLDDELKRLTFVSDNGVLHAERDGHLVSIELPAAPPVPCEPPAGLLEALGIGAARCAVSSDDILVEVDSAQAVAAVDPDFAALAAQPYRGHIVTAASEQAGVDFVSRTFFPALGVNEDQVCVTAHCKLAPHWAARLDLARLTALQLSERGGRLEMTLAGDRVRVLGTAVPR